jgi:acetyltransferase-like isoleucine patch superfamily enzyme
MQRDLRPYWVKRLLLGYRAWYAKHRLAPQFSSFGPYAVVMKPRYIEVFGPNVHLGRCATLIAEPDQRLRIGVWGRTPGSGELVIGDYALLTPGVRIMACDSIRIGNGCMFAHGAYVTDSDWHGIYDRIAIPETPRPVRIGDNVWVGDRATVLKGVTIGDNSIVAAGAVVTRDVAANTVVAGNPARPVKELDPDGPWYTRDEYLARPRELFAEFDALDREMLRDNRLLPWLKSLLWP